MKRLLALGALGALLCGLPPVRAVDREDQQAAKEGLQKLNNFIGGWKGNGSIASNASATWKETVRWIWRFKKGGDVWLSINIENGKYLKGGQLRYLVEKKRYQLRALDRGGKTVVYEGPLQKGRLILERVDPETKETQQLKMNLAASGIRFIYTFGRKPANRTLYTMEYQVACTKEGESFSAKASKVECIVSGGLGTIPVTYKGVTYYVCCTGCRDAFNEEPEKYIKEYEAKKRKK
jgi:hypothetical protein